MYRHKNIFVYFYQKITFIYGFYYHRQNFTKIHLIPYMYK